MSYSPLDQSQARSLKSGLSVYKQLRPLLLARFSKVRSSGPEDDYDFVRNHSVNAEIHGISDGQVSDFFEERGPIFFLIFDEQALDALSELPESDCLADLSFLFARGQIFSQVVSVVASLQIEFENSDAFVRLICLVAAIMVLESENDE